MDAENWCLLIGGGLIVTGCVLIYLPLGLIVAGLLVAGVGVLRGFQKECPGDEIVFRENREPRPTPHSTG